jgi:hypothetical protein
MYAAHEDANVKAVVGAGGAIIRAKDAFLD